MKLILCIYSLLAIVWAALLWFDSLLQIPFTLLILIGFFLSLFFAVKAFKCKGEWRGRLIAFMPLAIVTLCGAFLLLPLTDWKVKVDHCLLRGQRLKAIEGIPPNTLTLSEVKLPHWWLSSDGTAYVFNPNKDCLLVGFWVRRGMMSPSWIVAYSAQDRPPTEDDLHCDMVEVEAKLAPHWY